MLSIILGSLLFVQIKAKPKYLVLTTREKSLPSEVEKLTGLETLSENFVLTTSAEEVIALETDFENLVFTTPADDGHVNLGYCYDPSYEAPKVDLGGKCSSTSD